MNFGTPVPLLLGIILIVGAVALFFLDRLKPGYERDSDKVYAVFSLISGIFLLGNLTMELIPAFQQIIMVGMFVTLMIQNIRSRNPREGRTPQTAGGYDTPPDRDYRVGRPGSYGYRGDTRTNVRAELDRRDYPPAERMPQQRPMLGGRDDRQYSAYREPPRDDYGSDYYRSAPPASEAVGRLNPSSDRIRVRRPRPGKRGSNPLSIAPTRWDEGPSRPPNYRDDVYSGSGYDRGDEPPPSREGGSEAPPDPAAGPPYRYGRDAENNDYGDYRPLNLGEGGSDANADYRRDRPKDYGY